MNRIENVLQYTKKMNLLYVEDEDDMRNATISVFNDLFKSVTIAVDGKDGLEKFHSNDIDIIISDINMPHLCGLQMANQIRKVNKDIPIVIFSAHNESEYLEDAIRFDIDAYLLKPLNIDQFFESFEKIIDKLKFIHDNIEYKKQLEDKVKEQSLKVEEKEKELNLFKDDIITIFTHELKTPLNAILVYSEYIERLTHKELTPKKIEKIRELSKKIYTNSIAQQNTILTILEVGKIKAGKIDIVRKPLQISKVLYPIINNYKDVYEKDVETDIDNDLVVNLDEHIFTIVFTNLYSNALKYSKSKVFITFKNIDNNIQCIIEDDGYGIEEDKREKIFDIFEQLDSSPVLNRHKQGTGVGLYTVKHLLKFCNKGIKVERSSKLGGAKFIVNNI